MRNIITDGSNTKEAINVLSSDIQNKESLAAIIARAKKILEYSVDPVAGATDLNYGLLYGLIQSGKTSIITVTAAMAADNGFKCIIILTSDTIPLYDQTLQRIRSQLRGLTVLGKADWNDSARFDRQIRTSPFAIVSSKNKNHLAGLLEAFNRIGTQGAKGLPTLIIDDEADQASLNTKARKRNEEISAINKQITDLRYAFQTHTYLQVTATPQALFLQHPSGLYRPSFTVLSDAGDGYVGGEAFFNASSKLLRYVNLEEVEELKTAHQPHPVIRVPVGLRRAILNFLVGAAGKNLLSSTESFAFLCHISYTKVDHDHVVNVLDSFREEVLDALKNRSSRSFEILKAELQSEYEDLLLTEANLPSLDEILDRILFLIPGANIKVINANTKETVTLDHVFSFFVGGNKLGRGVTIPNLLTSYYGRNPLRPNADTVLQHARMYGYRKKHLGITRLFLPKRLAEHFRIIHKMEKALRDLVAKDPEGKFQGIYLESPLKPTRTNVLDPNSIGVYTAGSNCSPSYPLRSSKVIEKTANLDKMLAPFSDQVNFSETTVDFIKQLITECAHDPAFGAELWNIEAIKAGLEELKTLKGDKAYIRVRRDRNINEPRLESQGILSGGEVEEVPSDALTLFIYRMKKSHRGHEVWWPQIRFADGNYAIAFSFDR